MKTCQNRKHALTSRHPQPDDGDGRTVGTIQSTDGVSSPARAYPQPESGLGKPVVPSQRDFHIIYLNQPHPLVENRGVLHMLLCSDAVQFNKTDRSYRVLLPIINKNNSME